MGARMRGLGLVLAVAAGLGVPALPAAGGTDCGPRVVSIAGGRAAEGTVRGGFTTATFTVTTAGCPVPATLRYRTVGYTAGKDDFVATSGELAYKPGEQGTRTISVPVVADAVAESRECFSVRLTAATGKVRVDPAEAAWIVLDDDTRGAGGGFMCSE